MRCAPFVALAFAFAVGTRALSQAGPAEPDEEDGPSQILDRARLYLVRHGDFGKIDPEKRLAEIRVEYEKYQRRRLLLPETIGLDTWTSIGPTNGAGRMIAITPHPTIVGTLFAGAAGGGAWKTADGGVTWTPLTDGIPDLSVGALALAPSDPTVVYLGSGEGGYAIDFVPGIGFLKSTNGGGTWTLPASVLATQFYRINVHPTNPQELVVGTNAGGFRSTNGGTSFTPVIASATYRNVTDIVRHPTDPLTMYAATWCGFSCPTNGSRVLKSTDAGATWVEKSNGLPATVPDSLYERLSLAIAPTNPLVLYASTSIKSAPSASVTHVYKTTDGGDSWVDLAGVSTVSGLMAEQAWYNNTTVVSPTDANTVVVGGTSYARSTNGGTSWAFVGGGIHADAHDLRYQGSTLYCANDGGIYSSADNLTSSTARNTGLVTRQFYGIAIDAANPNRLLAGAQDNGTMMRQDAGGSTWLGVIGSDGFECALNPANSSIAYGTIQYGSIRRSTNAGVAFPTFSSITPPYAGGEATPFLSILTLDVNNPSTLYTGSYRVWRTTDGGTSWAPLPTTTTDSSAWSTGSTVTSIAVARSNSQVLMIGKSGSVFRSTDGGTTWIGPNSMSGLPGSNVNNLEIDPTDANTAFASLGTTSGNSVYRTTNGGASWSVRATGLPRFSVQVLRVDPTDHNDLFAGTDVGVYRSRDAGATWTIFGIGLPASSAQDIRISDDGTLVRLGTHGRGAWELKTGTAATTGFYSLIPCRVADTRNPAGPYGAPSLVANVSRSFALSGQCGIPSDAKAVVANVTVVNASVGGDMRIFPGGAIAPNSNSISFAPGRARACSNILMAGTPNLSVTVVPVIGSGTVDFILDVSGYFK